MNDLDRREKMTRLVAIRIPLVQVLERSCLTSSHLPLYIPLFPPSSKSFLKFIHTYLL